MGFLLVAALGADERFWDEACAELERYLPCRKLGQAAAAPPAQVALMEERRRDAGWSRVIAVGCAVGSMAAAAYAGAHPERAAAAILVNATGRTGPDAAAMLRQRATRVRQGGMAAILPEAVDRPFDGQARDHRYARYLERFAAQDAERYAQALEVSADYDASDLIDQIRCPALVIAGGRDLLLPPAQARRVHERVAGSAFEQFDEVAHFIPYQAPQRFAARAIAFVRDQVDSAGEPMPTSPRR